jgi:DUF4097 and DUF4098 domain-containing protein YvlB
MKKILMVVIALFAVAIVFTSIGLLVIAKDYEKPIERTIEINQEKVFDADEISYISLDMGYDDINVYVSNDDKIRFKYFGTLRSTNEDFNASMYIEEQRTQLNIHKTSYARDEKIRFFDLDEYYRDDLVLEVYIPINSSLNLEIESSKTTIEDLEFNSLVIETYSRDISLKNVSAKDLIVKASSGDIELSYVDSDKLDVRTYSGAAIISNVVANDFDCEFSSGKLLLSDAVLKDIRCEAYSGDLSFDNLEFDKAKVKTSSGEVDFDIVVLGDLEIETYSGEVSLDVPTNASFNLNFDSYSGDLRNTFPIVLDMNSEFKVSGLVGDAANAKDVFVDTSSGDLTIN